MPTYEQAEAERRALYNVAHARHKKSKKGYQHNVPCIWCGKHNDFRISPVPKKGDSVECDYCGNLMFVEEVIHKPIFVVKQIHDKPKPPYEPKNRDEWERQQQEAQRVAVAHVDIDREDAARAQILGIDRDLVEVFRGLPMRYVQQFAALRNMIGRDGALLKLPEWRQQHIKEQKEKTKQ